MSVPVIRIFKYADPHKWWQFWKRRTYWWALNSEVHGASNLKLYDLMDWLIERYPDHAVLYSGDEFSRTTFLLVNSPKNQNEKMEVDYDILEERFIPRDKRS